MHFTATNQNYSNLEVTNEQLGTVGLLECNTWFPKKAQIVINNGNTYLIEATGFWRSSMSITKNGLTYAELKTKAANHITLSFANGRSFMFKRKSIWNGGYVMIDEAENEIATLDAYFKWSKFSFQYEMEVSDSMPDNESSLFLPFILLYCTRYMRMRGAAA